VDIVRWNGPRTNFTILVHNTGTTLNDGDTIKATVIGNTIKAYINDVEKASVTDSTYTSGQPGIGFFQDGGTTAELADFNLTSLTVTA
jgi:hypothetical protein